MTDGNNGSSGHLYALRRSLKNSESNAKKMRQRRRSEQDGDRRRRTFTPLEFLQFRIGAHTNLSGIPTGSHRGHARGRSHHGLLRHKGDNGDCANRFS